MPLKIGIDISPLSRKFYSGTEWYLWHLVSALAKKKAANNYHWQLYLPRAVTCTLDLPANWELVYLSWPSKHLWLKGRLSLEMLINPPDLLFTPANALPFILPSKIVSTVHDLGFKECPQVYSRWERFGQNLAIHRVLKKSQPIIAISETTKLAIQKYYPRLARLRQVRVIPLAIDPDRFFSHPKQQAGPRPYLLFVGRISQKKNVLGLIKAYEKLVAEKTALNLELWLVGMAGYGWSEIKEKIKSVKGVKYFPWQSPAELTTIILGAKALVLPSWAEGFGLPVLEAQAAGVPVVCADIPALRETAGNGALYFSLKHQPDFSRALTEVLNNKKLREQLIKEGFINQNRFQLSRLAADTLAVLAEAMRH